MIMRSVMSIRPLLKVILPSWPEKNHSEWVVFSFKLISEIWFSYLFSYLKHKRGKSRVWGKAPAIPACKGKWEGKATEHICLSFYKILRLYVAAMRQLNMQERTNFQIFFFFLILKNPVSYAFKIKSIMARMREDADNFSRSKPFPPRKPSE